MKSFINIEPLKNSSEVINILKEYRAEKETEDNCDFIKIDKVIELVAFFCGKYGICILNRNKFATLLEIPQKELLATLKWLQTMEWIYITEPVPLRYISIPNFIIPQFNTDNYSREDIIENYRNICERVKEEMNEDLEFDFNKFNEIIKECKVVDDPKDAEITRLKKQIKELEKMISYSQDKKELTVNDLPF